MLKSKKILFLSIYFLFCTKVAFSLYAAYSAENDDDNEIIEFRSSQREYSNSSVLSSGKWMKISVDETGIHKIPYSKLTEWGFATPAKVRVFGYGGEMLPAANNEPRPDDLPEVAILHYNNAIYFYAQDLAVWRWNNTADMFMHEFHRYSNNAFYFLTDKQGNIKNIEKQTAEQGTATTTVTSFDDVRYHEKDLRKLASTGYLYFGEEINSGNPQTFSFSFPSREVAEPIKLASQVLTKPTTYATFDFKLKNQTSNILSILLGAKSWTTYQLGFVNSGRTTFTSSSNNIDLELVFSGNIGSGYLDYIVLNARSSLKLNDSQLIFRDKKSNLPNGIALFKMTNTKAETVVWDITNRNDAKEVSVTKNGNSLEFKVSVSQLKEFVAFNPSGNFPLPVKVEDIENQNLHSFRNIDYIIVAPKDFHVLAEELADLHFQYYGLNTIIVTPEQIYNEFSWGHQDATAIRSFAKMIYDRDATLKYLLLFGSGSYDNKGILPNHNTKYNIVTWQSEHSYNESNSYTTDDYFGFLDDNAGSNNSSNLMRIGIGRLPVYTLNEAEICVNKVRRYLEEQNNGSWRRQVTFLADEKGDNAYEKEHLIQAEQYSEMLENNHPEFLVNKIYMDSYPIITSSSGRTIPEASDAANRAVNDGTLIFNYIGHGSPKSIAHEKIITPVHVPHWKNIKALSFWLTATCELSRFDDHNVKSLGEQIFLTPHGGAIAMLTTTRLTGIASNGSLMKDFYDLVLSTNENDEKRSIGEIVMLTKNRRSSAVAENHLKFVLFGDPALKLAHPDEKMKLDSIMDIRKINPITNEPERIDTIKALSHITLSGNVETRTGEKMDDFNGIAEITVFDKQVNKSTLGNGDNNVEHYTEYSNILFNGRASVTNGSFSSEFIVPHDIRYNFDNGKISMYAYSTDNNDKRQAAGADKSFVIGGFDDNAPSDNKGPIISMYLNYETFKSGDVTGRSPLLFARIEDESGINVGNGIGHDLLLTIDGDVENAIVLNNYYQGEIDNFRAGTLIFQLPEMNVGNHELALKAWDTHNNSTIGTINFAVGKSNELEIKNFRLGPVPVPLHLSEIVHFSFDTDEPNSKFTLSIDGINWDGSITGKINKEVISDGMSVEKTELSLYSLGIRNRGNYFIRFVVTSDTGKKGQIAQKIIVIP
ncbi:MAG: type IX secretion system sortase PorU [Marinilabiliaceae bacterium]|nr:type IX secretion system sortase PorU [Marinilabiliaceae bacterium]